jgi:membrane protein required for beta-lactamase induction
MKWAILVGLPVGVAEILAFMRSPTYRNQWQRPFWYDIRNRLAEGSTQVLTVKGWCGVVLIAAGIALVGMDQGTRSAGLS